jgi:hypothetical protein
MTMLAILTGILSYRFLLAGLAIYVGCQAGSDGNAGRLTLVFSLSILSMLAMEAEYAC